MCECECECECVCVCFLPLPASLWYAFVSWYSYTCQDYTTLSSNFLASRYSLCLDMAVFDCWFKLQWLYIVHVCLCWLCRFVLMGWCWALTPVDRPRFSHLTLRLKEFNEKISAFVWYLFGLSLSLFLSGLFLSQLLLLEVLIFLAVSPPFSINCLCSPFSFV